MDRPAPRATNKANCPTPWLGEQRGYLVDWLTQVWAKRTGRIVDLREEPWLRGPIGETRSIGDDYFARLAQHADQRVRVNAAGSGLMARFVDLRADHVFRLWGMWFVTYPTPEACGH
jgi:hypothetical protein